MAAVAWKIPERWRSPGLADRTAVYPALYLGWSGESVAIGRRFAGGRWGRADLRVMVTDGPFAEDERDLMAEAAVRGRRIIVAPQAGLTDEDRALVQELGFAVAAIADDGPLASAPPGRRGVEVLTAPGCAARLAEDLALASALGLDPPPACPVAREHPFHLAVVDSVEALDEIRRAMARAGLDERRLVAVCEDEALLAQVPGLATMSAADPALLQTIGQAQTVLCGLGGAPPDTPRPGQWVRTALFQGVPVIAASHPSIDGLAHLCVLDDWERGLKLYGGFAIERLKAGVTAQAFLADRIEPEAVAGAWRVLAEAKGGTARPAAAGEARTPLLLVLIDIHQDLDLLLPVLLALKTRDEIRLKLVLTDWLTWNSPRVANALAGHGFAFEVFPREAVRAGDVPSLAGVDGVLSGAETNVRAHKAGHTLVSRANERGLPTFTLQHGFENIGLTYKDQLHDEGVRFAARTIFTWCASEALADWIAPETRAAVAPVGSPKAAPPAAKAPPLNQGEWSLTVGVFENLHWARFSDDYRRRFIEDLEAAAEANRRTLFLIKPHHAGRWTSRNRALIGERANLVVTDPTNSAWEPHTAPALIAGVDKVVTTPSTVALDAVQTGKPTAVFGYDLELPLYQPLPVIGALGELQAFLDETDDAFLLRNEAFLKRARLPGRADHRIAARIAEALRQARTGKPAGRRLVRSG